VLATDSIDSLRARCARLWPASVLALAACGGGAEPRSVVPIAPTEAVEITYADGATRLTLRAADLVDEASYRTSGLYGEVTPDVKFADRRTMQALVDAMHELGHFDRGGSQIRAGAKASLDVRIGDRRTVWSQPALQPENMDELERFNTARAAFLQVHNDIISYHASSMSKTDFERALTEQNAKNQESVRSILEKSRGRGQ
jgi:hypothetical protein